MQSGIDSGCPLLAEFKYSMAKAKAKKRALFLSQFKHTPHTHTHTRSLLGNDNLLTKYLHKSGQKMVLWLAVGGTVYIDFW